MKSYRIILILSLLLCFNRAYGQITLDVQQTPLPKVLQKIKKQCGYYFFYDDKQLKNEKVTIKISNASLVQTLDLCFKNIPFTFKILERNVVISPKLIEKVPAIGTRGVPAIKGLVTDLNGNGLMGATVYVGSYKLVVITNSEGKFVLNGIADKNVMAEVSFIGYRTAEVMVKDIDRVVLEQVTSPLNETQVIAYGTESKRFKIGSTTSITAKDIASQSVSDPLLALQGRVAGLTVTASSGAPGAQVRLQIRGQNTISPGAFDQPLFIIDGVPFAPQNRTISQYSSLPNYTTYNNSGGNNNVPGGVSPFNNINPADIESISVLKDADATSIYGSQGANGVIIITTKRGKPGKTSFSLDVKSGYTFAAQPVALLNTAQYLQIRNEAFNNDNIRPGSNSADKGYAPDLTIYDLQKYTDFYKNIYGNTAQKTDMHGALSGGSVNDNFILSMGATKTTYNFPGDFADERYTLHSSYRHVSPDQKLNVTLGNDYSYDQNNSIAQSVAGTKILLPPNTPDLLDPNGNLLWTYNGVSLRNAQFYAYLKQPAGLKSYTLLNTLSIGYKITDKLNIKIDGGYSRLTTTETTAKPIASQYPSFPFATASFGNSSFQTMNLEPQLNYTTKVEKGILNVLVGGNL
jgi:TonB-dependent starch-binding outer membrane protein SusC